MVDLVEREGLCPVGHTQYTENTTINCDTNAGNLTASFSTKQKSTPESTGEETLRNEG